MSTQAKRGIPVISISFEKTDVVKSLDTLTYVLNSHMGKSSATLLLANIADVLDNERVSVFFSEELAKAYLNVSVKTLPIMSVLYTSYMNIVSVVKLAGISEATEKLNSLISKVRSKKKEPAVVVKRVAKPRTTAATKAAE